jgi:hypothetical protein
MTDVTAADEISDDARARSNVSGWRDALSEFPDPGIWPDRLPLE